MSKQHKKHEEAAPAAGAVPPATPAEVAPPAVSATDASTEAAELKERLLRLQADFDNFRKRSRREMAESAQLVTEAFFRDLLSVVDHFELGLRTAAEHGTEPAVQNGFRLVYDELLRVGRKYALEPVDAAPGAVFDPSLHEAITHVPSVDIAVDAVVLQTRRGFRLGDRLVRPAQVVVSSGPPAASDDAPAGNA